MYKYIVLYINRFRGYLGNQSIDMDLPSGTALSIAKRKIPTKTAQIPSHTNNPDQLDCNFYVRAYKDVNPRFTNPFTHYYTIGKLEDRLPNENKFRELYPLFDLHTYIERNADLARLPKEELLSHFHTLGRFECRAYR